MKQVPDGKGINQHTEHREGALPTRTEAATDAGLSEHQRKTALRVASVDDETFNTAIDAPVPPTITELAEWGRASLKPAEAWLDDARAREGKKFRRVPSRISPARDARAREGETPAANLQKVSVA